MSYEIIGPFDAYRVVVGGRQVPYLNAHPANGGIVHLTLDNRFGLDIAVADAEAVIPFIADCIAVAMGYTCHPAADEEPVRSVPFRRQHGVESVKYGQPCRG